MYRSTTTIEDVYRLALPPETRLLTGDEYLGQAVTWACSLRPSPPAFPKLDGNELALIDMEDLRRLDPQMRLDRVVFSLQNAHIASIAVLGRVDASAVNAARATRLALFQLPASVSLVQVERAVIRLIVDRAGYISQRSAELQRELNQLALHGGGLAEMTQHVQQFAQQPVLLLREDGHVSTEAGLGALPESEKRNLLGGLPNMTELRGWVASAASNGSSKGAGVLPLQAGAPYRQAIVAPIIA